MPKWSAVTLMLARCDARHSANRDRIRSHRATEAHLASMSAPCGHKRLPGGCPAIHSVHTERRRTMAHSSGANHVIERWLPGQDSRTTVFVHEIGLCRDFNCSDNRSQLLHVKGSARALRICPVRAAGGVAMRHKRTLGSRLRADVCAVCPRGSPAAPDTAVSEEAYPSPPGTRLRLAALVPGDQRASRARRQ